MRGNILIADDDPIMGNLLETRLYESGYNTEYVGAADAPGVISQKKPDLMILNSIRSGKSISEFYDQIRISPEANRIACIILCAENESGEFTDRLTADGNEYIRKPFIMADLLKLVQDCFEKIHDISSPGTPVQETTREISSYPDIADAFRQGERDQFTGVAELLNCSAKSGVFFQFGRLVHAYHGSTTGKKALYRIFSDSCDVVSFQSQSVTVRTIDDPLEVLIEEGIRDAAAINKLKPETFQSVVSVNPATGNTDAGKNPAIAATLSLIGTSGKVRDIIDKHPLTDIQVYKQLIYLIRLGVLTFEPFTEKAPIRIITDSTADLPREFTEDNQIIVIPQTISINQDTYRDGKDIFPDEFYRLLKHSKQYPVTYPPSEKEFDNVFKTLIPENDILALMISKKLSKTVEYSCSAKEHHMEEYARLRRGVSEYSQPKLEIIDSRTASMGLGLLALEAAEKSALGWSFEKITGYIEKIIPFIKVFFVVESLEYLQRSGRIGKLKGILGRLFNVAPILGFYNGEVIVIDRVIGEKTAQERMAELILENLTNPSTPFKIGIMHADNLKWAEKMSELMESRLNCKKIIMTHMGPSVVSHCGLGTVGIACLPISDSGEWQSPWR